MNVEYVFNGINFRFPTKRAFSRCAKAIAAKVPEVTNLHFAVKKGSGGIFNYEIDLRAVTDTSDILSSVRTKNIFKGLKAIKNATVQRLRDDRKKMITNFRRAGHEHRHEFPVEEERLKEAL